MWKEKPEMKIKRSMFEFPNAEQFINQVIHEASEEDWDDVFSHENHWKITNDVFEAFEKNYISKFEAYVNDVLSQNPTSDQIEHKTICEKCHCCIPIIKQRKCKTCDGGDYYCKCKSPTFKLNRSILEQNLTCLCWRVLARMHIWYPHLMTLTITYHDVLENLPKLMDKVDNKEMINSTTRRHYFLNTLLLDIFNFINLIKTDVFLLSKNVLLTKQTIDKILANEKIQLKVREFCHYDVLVQDLIETMQIQLGIDESKRQKTSHLMELLVKMSKTDFFLWSRDMDECLHHKHINITFGSIPWFKMQEERKIDTCHFLLIYLWFLFYIVLDAFDYLE